MREKYNFNYDLNLNNSIKCYILKKFHNHMNFLRKIKQGR